MKILILILLLVRKACLSHQEKEHNYECYQRIQLVICKHMESNRSFPEIEEKLRHDLFIVNIFIPCKKGINTQNLIE